MNNQSASPLLPSTKLRSSELDFVKGVLITLMVLFHLSYFVERHVALTEWVYTFHMSGFLVISGFLFNAEKDWHGFGKTLRSIAVPYVVFEDEQSHRTLSYYRVERSCRGTGGYILVLAYTAHLHGGMLWGEQAEVERVEHGDARWKCVVRA